MDTTWPDISEHQPNANIAGIRQMTDVIAARASYGTRLDLCMPARRDAIRAQNFDLVTWYLFLRATQDVQAQVNTVISCLGDLRSGEFVAVDFEKDGTMPTVAQRNQASALLRAHYGRPTIDYMNASTETADPTSDPVWVAGYSRVEPAGPHIICPRRRPCSRSMRWAGTRRGRRSWCCVSGVWPTLCRNVGAS